MKSMDFALHLVRSIVGLVLLVVLGPRHVLLAVALSVNLYLACFAFAHDVAHGALRLPRALNEIVLALSALPMAVSGHSMRLMHLRHHARPLARDDVEGVGAALPLWRAILAGPWNAFELRRQGFLASRRGERNWVLVESLVSAALMAVALLSRHQLLVIWAATNIGLALGASAWASHLPHHPPKWARRVAVRLAWTGSATVLSFAFHEAHHARPKLPCRALAGCSVALVH